MSNFLSDSENYVSKLCYCLSMKLDKTKMSCSYKTRETILQTPNQLVCRSSRLTMTYFYVALCYVTFNKYFAKTLATSLY